MTYIKFHDFTCILQKFMVGLMDQLDTPEHAHTFIHTHAHTLTNT